MYYLALRDKVYEQFQMNSSRRYIICHSVLFGVFFFGKVFSCEIPSGERIKCKDASTPQDCPKTCCFDETTTPNCFFEMSAYGPIQHSNGLCINVEDDKRTLIWSRDCSSANAFFLVSHDYPAYHVTTGKCVLPIRSVSDPGRSADLFLTSRPDCSSHVVKYRPRKNGNLGYFYHSSTYELCIGSKSLNEPRENDKVSFQETVCFIDNTCKLSYVYERRFSEGESVNLKCESCKTIENIWANYGVQVPGRYPFAISTSSKDCVASNAISVVENKCKGKTQCSFVVQSRDFLESTCEQNKTLLVRFRCDSIPAPPRMLSIVIKSQTELDIFWSNDNNKDVPTKFKMCWKNAITETCASKKYWSSTPNMTIPNLQPATKYIITIARYKENIIGHRRQKIAITRSAPPQATGVKSATSFQIKLRALQIDDIYFQIVLSKQQKDEKPTSHPGTDLQPHSKTFEDNKPYITVELRRNYPNKNRLFTVGDDMTYVGSKDGGNIDFQNVKLEPDTFYSVFQRTFKTKGLYYDSDWMDVIKTDKLQPSTPPSPLTEITADMDISGADDCDKSLAGIIVPTVLLIISLVINGYCIYQNRRLKSSKETSDRNIPTDKKPENHGAIYEDVKDEQSTYTALKRPEDEDDHLYTHLQMNTLQHDYMNQNETGIQ